MIFTPLPYVIPRSKKKDVSYAQLILFGLNYSFRGIRNHQILLNLHHSNKYTITCPLGLIARVYKRRLVLFGNKLILQQFLHKVAGLRPANIYTGKGVRIRSLPYKIKPGKVKRR